MTYLTDALDERGLPTWVKTDRKQVADIAWKECDTDYEQVRQITTPHGTFRAVVTLDTHPDKPVFDYGDPVYRATAGAGGYELTDLKYGGDRGAGLDIREVWDRLYMLRGVHHAAELVDRYLRIFHDGAAELMWSTTDRSGDPYLVWATRATREHHGATGDAADPRVHRPEAPEWQAFIDGEVYSISMDRGEHDEDGDVSWTEVEDMAVSGFYGERWAKEAAEEALHDVISAVAGDMPPLGGEEG